jgi:hypothetical protein
VSWLPPMKNNYMNKKNTGPPEVEMARPGGDETSRALKSQAGERATLPHCTLAPGFAASATDRRVF